MTALTAGAGASSPTPTKASREELQFTKDNRAYFRGRVTRICNKVIVTQSLEDCEENLDKLKSFGSKLIELDSKVSSQIWKHHSIAEKGLNSIKHSLLNYSITNVHLKRIYVMVRYMTHLYHRSDMK